MPRRPGGGEGGAHSAETGMRIYEVYGKSERSVKHANQDAYVVDGERGFIGVFDGMTKPVGGERAASVAKAASVEVFGKKNLSSGTIEEARRAMDLFRIAAQKKTPAPGGRLMTSHCGGHTS